MFGWLISGDYEKIQKQFIDMNARLSNFEADLTALSDSLRSLRGRVNKKLAPESDDKSENNVITDQYKGVLAGE